MPYNLLMHYMRIWKYTIPTFKYRVGKSEEVIKNGQSRDIEQTRTKTNKAKNNTHNTKQMRNLDPTKNRGGTQMLV